MNRLVTVGMGIVLSPACDRVRNQVSLELDGELSSLERMMVARHLERCADCREFRDDAVAIADALRSAPLESLERPIVLPRLRRGQLVALRGAALRVGTAAAGIALVLGLGLGDHGFFGTGHSKPRSAYLDSPNYEQQLINQLRAYKLAETRSDVRPV